MTTDISQYKCPNCGATLPFDANEGKLKCSHCGTTVELEALKETASLETSKSDEYGWEDVSLDNVNSIEGQKTYVCPSCGGVVNGDGSMAVSQCPYCGNSVIVEKQFEGMLKPNLVIPFKYSKEDAKKAFAKYLKGKNYWQKFEKYSY
jgi:TFIIB zinc-binding.